MTTNTNMDFTKIVDTAHEAYGRIGLLREFYDDPAKRGDWVAAGIASELRDLRVEKTDDDKLQTLINRLNSASDDILKVVAELAELQRE